MHLVVYHSGQYQLPRCVYTLNRGLDKLLCHIKVALCAAALCLCATAGRSAGVKYFGNDSILYQKVSFKGAPFIHYCAVFYKESHNLTFALQELFCGSAS